MNKPNGQRFWYPPSINHSSVCQKPGGPVVWIQSALWHYLDEDRYYPVHGPVPQCWRWTPISPAWRWSFPRITQSVLPWSPSNNIALWIFIALSLFSGILYQKKPTHSIAEMLFFHALWVIWVWQVIDTSFYIRDVAYEVSCFLIIYYLSAVFDVSIFDHLVWK